MEGDSMYGSLSGCLGAAALFCFFQVFGLCLSAVLLPRESPGARMLLGSVLGSVSLQWFPALAAFAFGFTLTAHGAAAAFAAAIAAACALWAKKRGLPLSPFAGFKDAARAFLRHKFLFAAAALWGFFCFLVLHSFRWESARVFSSQATYGDMAMHLSFITSLARQGTFPPNYSLLPGTRLSYPFLSDSISSSLYLLGAPLRLAYCLPMFAAGAQVVFGGWLFFHRMMEGRSRAAVALTLFFFNGGLGLLWFLGGPWENFTRIFTAFYETPTNYYQENIRWVNVVVDMMLPQRATLFGWAVLFPVLCLLYRGIFQKDRACFPVVGLLAGALPMIHTHSFLALALVCGSWLTAELLELHQRGPLAVKAGKVLILLGLGMMTGLKAWLSQTDAPWLLAFAVSLFGLWAVFVLVLVVLAVRKGNGPQLGKTWGILLLLTCLLALPQLFTWTFRQVSGGGMVRGHFGWVTGPDNYLWFYLKNLGPTAILGLLGLLLAKKEAFARYCPLMAIWFLAEFVEFQPNDYDNNKLLYVGFLFLCCAAADGLFRIFRLLLGESSRHTARAWAAGAAVFLFSLPAILTMGREAIASYELFGEGALRLCQYIEAELPPDAIVLTDQRHNNEVASLTGRNIVCGSSSYLFYHGLGYYHNEEAARLMYEQPLEYQNLFPQFGVDYVLISDFEENSFQVDQASLESMFEKVYDDGVRRLYKTNLESGGNP